MTVLDYLKNFMVEAFKTTAQLDANQTLALHARKNKILNRQPSPLAPAPIKMVSAPRR